MKQYCRYCCSCIPGNGCPYYCTDKDKVLSDSTIRRVNNCEHFIYCDAGDVDTGKQYVQRERKYKRQIDGQLTLGDFT